MPVPEMVQATLEKERIDLDGVLADGIECEGARYHSPNPLILHRIEVEDGDVVLLCGTCRDNLDVFDRLMRSQEGELAWPVRREFGNLIRAIGLRVWAARSAGG